MFGCNFLCALTFVLIVVFGTPALGQNAERKQDKAAHSETTQKPAAVESTEQPPVNSIVTPPTPTSAIPVNTQRSQSTPTQKIEGSSKSFFGWQDTGAQWTMAATGVLALLVSCWAVWLLKETLKATRTAVREAEAATKAAEAAVAVTRDVGQAQMRAYINFTEIKAYISGNAVCVLGTLKNSGNTPPKNLRLTIQVACIIGTGELVQVEPRKTIKVFPNDIVPGDTAEYKWTLNGALTDNEVRDWNPQNAILYFVDIRQQFEDVFDVPIEGITSYMGSKPPGNRLNTPATLTRKFPDNPEA